MWLNVYFKTPRCHVSEDIKNRLIRQLAATTNVGEKDVQAVLDALNLNGTLEAVASLPAEEQMNLTVNSARIAFKLSSGGMAS